MPVDILIRNPLFEIDRKMQWLCVSAEAIQEGFELSDVEWRCDFFFDEKMIAKELALAGF